MDWFKFLLNNTWEELRETVVSIYQNKRYLRKWIFIMNLYFC